MIDSNNSRKAYRSHRHYLAYVWEVFRFLSWKTFYANREVYENIWNGIVSTFILIMMFVGVILSPILCWYGGYKSAIRTRKRYVSMGGEFYGKMAHLNAKYKVDKT